MIQVLLIGAFLVLHAHDEFSPPALFAAPVVVTILASWLIPAGVFLVAHLLCVRESKRLARGDGAAYLRGQLAVLCGRAVMAAAWAMTLLVFDLPGAWRSVTGDLIWIDEVLCLLPLWVFIALGALSMLPLERHIRESLYYRDLASEQSVHPAPTPWSALAALVRHQMLMILLPLSLIAAWHEVVNVIGPSIHGPGRFPPELVSAVLAIAGVVLILAFVPLLLRLAWDTTPLSGSAVADEIRAMCAAHRVRITGPLVWRTRGSMLNAVVLGFLWPFRYMLFTDVLLEVMERGQLRAVAAHEIAHVRKRHMWWLAAAVVATVLVAGSVLGAALYALPERLSTHPASAFAASLLVLAFVVLVFGFVSRRFEWQADAFAVRQLAMDEASPVCTPLAVESMASALRKVSEYGGIPEQRFSFRHGSIASRRKRVYALLGVPVDAMPIDRAVSRLKIVVFVVLIAGLAVVAWDLAQLMRQPYATTCSPHAKT